MTVLNFISKSIFLSGFNAGEGGYYAPQGMIRQKCPGQIGLKSCSDIFHKIHSETPVLESLFK